MTAWVVVVAVGAGSFLFRLGPLLLLRRTAFSSTADRAIRHAGLAAVSALIGLSTLRSAEAAAPFPALLTVGVGVLLAARRVSMLRLVAIGGAIYATAAVLAGGLVG